MIVTPPPHPGGRLWIHFRPPVCHNGLWLLDVGAFNEGGVGHSLQWPRESMVAPKKPRIQVKLKPKLFDLFQHCELRCTAGCCGWDAFDLPAHWLRRWCEFREPNVVDAARSEIASLRAELSGRAPDDLIALDRFFDPSVQSLVDHLDEIDVVLASTFE